MRPALILAIAVPLLAQYPGGTPYPGGSPYPGGQRYPGTGTSIPGIPRRGKQTPAKSKDAAQQLEDIRGALRQMDAKSITISTADNRLVTARRLEKTQFTAKGVEADPSQWKPGDWIRIEASQDEDGYYHAVNVAFEREGTEQERRAAAVPVEPASGEPEQKQRGEDDRPILRRAGTKAEAADKPAATPPVEAAKAPAEPEEPEELRRGPLKPLDDKPMDDSDPGRPKIKRGRPEPRVVARSTKPEPVAEAAPPPTAASAPKVPAWKTPEYNEEKASTPARAPKKEDLDEDPRIAKAREVTNSYLASLPNYFCKEVIARYVSDSRPVSWRAVDVLSMALVYENGKERYTNLTVNGKPVKKNIDEVGGAWSTGEFASILRALFDPGSAAEFRLASTTSIGGRDAVMFNFAVEQARSGWRIQAPGQVYYPAYKGSVWIDRETSQVLRVEMQSSKIPSTFPFDTVETAVDLGFVRIGEQQYVLPLHAEVLSCQRGTSNCMRNVMDFRNYHKFSGESTITFSDSSIEYK